MLFGIIERARGKDSSYLTTLHVCFFRNAKKHPITFKKVLYNVFLSSSSVSFVSGGLPAPLRNISSKLKRRWWTDRQTFRFYGICSIGKNECCPLEAMNRKCKQVILPCDHVEDSKFENKLFLTFTIKIISKVTQYDRVKLNLNFTLLHVFLWGDGFFPHNWLAMSSPVTKDHRKKCVREKNGRWGWPKAN